MPVAECVDEPWHATHIGDEWGHPLRCCLRDHQWRVLSKRGHNQHVAPGENILQLGSAQRASELNSRTCKAVARLTHQDQSHALQLLACFLHCRHCLSNVLHIVIEVFCDDNDHELVLFTVSAPGRFAEDWLDRVVLNDQ